MKARALGVVLLLAATVFFTLTQPRAPILQAPFVVSVQEGRTAVNAALVGEIAGDVVSTSHVDFDEGTSLDAADGETLVVVPLRVASQTDSFEFLNFRLWVDGAVNYATLPTGSYADLGLEMIQPGIWLSGFVTFRVSAADVANASSLRFQATRGPVDDDTFDEVIEFRLRTPTPVESATVTVPVLGGTWAG